MSRRSAAARDKNRVTTPRVDVVVVGAGPAGLMAARRLQDAGRSVLVFEARSRVGGRTWSKVVDGCFLELGGQWISPDQDCLLSLLGELHFDTYPRYRQGASIYRGPNGRVSHFDGHHLPVPLATQKEVGRLTAILDDLASQVGCDNPWAHPQATALDHISFKQWLEQQSTDSEARANISLFMAGGMLTKPAHAFSALQAVVMAASAGSFTHLTDDTFILDQRVVGGMQSVCEAIARDVNVVTGAPVRAVRATENGIQVTSDRGTANGQHVVMAVPPNLYSRVSYDPPLPARQHQMHQHFSLGQVIKVHAVYDKPFWRDAGLSGTCFGVDSLVQEVYDNTNFGDPRGTLVGFVSDEKADRLLSLREAERRRLVLDSMADYLGPQTREPIVYYESDWASEEWTRGAYAASFDLGGLTRYGPSQHEPVGNIHWANADTATRGYQHVDGALRRGAAVADAIIEQSEPVERDNVDDHASRTHIRLFSPYQIGSLGTGPY